MKTRLFLSVYIALCFSHQLFSQAGMPDSTFGINGVVNISVPLNNNETYFEANQIAQQKDGKFIVLATAYRLNPEFTNAYIYRFKSNGNLDSTFGKNGSILYYSRKHNFVFGDLCIDSNDNIIFSKSIYNDTAFAFAAVRLNKNGKVDNSFSKDGIVEFGKENNIYSSGNHLAIQPDGKILISCIYGLYNYSMPATSILLRLNQNGSIDSSFNKTGRVIYKKAEIGGGAGEVLILPSGKIISGSSVLHCVNKNGRQDTTFGDNGTIIPRHYIINDYGDEQDTSHENLYSLYNAGDGFMCAGKVWGYDAVAEEAITTITVYKFTKKGQLDNSMSNDGQLSLYNYAYSVNERPFVNSLVVQPDRNFIIDNYNYRNSSYKLIRYLKNGEKDTSFGNDKGVDVSRTINKILLQKDYKIVTLTSTKIYITGDTGYFSLRRYNNDSKIFSQTQAQYITAKPSIKISPNPVTNTLHVNGLFPNADLFIMNLQGKILQTKNVSTSSYNWNIQNLPAGNYFLAITQNNKITGSLKFIKQ